MSARTMSTFSITATSGIHHMMRKQKGFSLIELLLVVVIILVLATIAIPNLMRSRMSANEASAVASMRTIVTSEIIYSTTYTVGFSTDLPSLSDGGTPSNCQPPSIPAAGSACLIDAHLAAGRQKREYGETPRPHNGRRRRS